LNAIVFGMVSPLARKAVITSGQTHHQRITCLWAKTSGTVNAEIVSKLPA
jgi:hypothetical protein